MYPSTMTEEQKGWYQDGIDRGVAVADSIAPEKVGDKWDCAIGKLLEWDEMISELYESESNSRQFSPFEMTAKEINDSEYPDELWEAFDSGISEGILTTMENWQA